MDASSDSLVCNSCRHSMNSADERTTHYKSEWHRYNVKRRCAGLQPIAQTLFASQLSQLQSKKEQVGKEKEKQHCAPCNKSFASAASYQAHLQSNKHIKAAQEYEAAQVAQAAEAAESVDDEQDASVRDLSSVSVAASKSSLTSPSPSTSSSTSSSSLSSTSATASSSSSSSPSTDASDNAAAAPSEPVLLDEDGNYILRDGEQAIPVGTCLFCRTPTTFDTVDACVAHMERAHSFFIPFRSRLVALEDMLQYLGEKVGIGHICLYCNGRGRARYPSTSAVQQHMFDKGHCKLRLDTEEEEDEFMDYYDFEVPQEDDEEEDEGEYDEDAEDEGADANGKKAPKRAVLVGLTDAGEALLSDGSTLGHRQYRRVYNQRVRVRVEPESVLVQQQYLLQTAVERGLISMGELASLGLTTANADGTGALVPLVSASSSAVSTALTLVSSSAAAAGGSSSSSSSSSLASQALTLSTHSSMAMAYMRRKERRMLSEGDEARKRRKHPQSWWKKMEKKHDLYIGIKRNNQSHYRAQVML